MMGLEVAAMCRELGFALAGCCDALPSDHREELIAWLKRGNQGSMSWLERCIEERLDPAALLPGAKSIIMVADVYASERRDATVSTAGRGRIARYARGDDYHVVIRKRLHRLCDALRLRHPGEEFRAFVDTAPVLEREHALRAGLGWIGKHTLLIHPDLGSWLLLGGVLTTMKIEPIEEQSVMPDHCGTCTRCIDACPTQAITPYSMDARRCISYLTIEHRDAIPAGLHALMGDWIFGCDICQEVCPHNRVRSGERDVLPAYRPRRDSFNLLDVLGWSDEDRRRAASRSALKRAKLSMWKRNALIAAANAVPLADAATARALRDRIRAVAEDSGEPDVVRSTAREMAALLDRRNT